MIKTIQQGLDHLDNLSIDEVQSLIASSFSAFEVSEQAENAADMQDYLNAARAFTEKKDALTASVAEAEPEVASEAVEASTSEPEPEVAPEPEPEAAPEPEPEAAPEAEPEAAPESDEATTASADESSSDTESEVVEDTTEAVEASADTKEPPEADADTAGAEAQAETTTSEETTVTASASVDEDIQVPEDNQPVASAADYPVTVTAGADISKVSAGSAFKNKDDVGRAFISRIRAIKSASGGDGERHTVATITASYPEDRMLDDDAESNAKKIANVLAPEGLTASGGYCAPLPVRYDIFGVGVSARPVRDSFPMFNASRGGVRFVQPPVLTDMEGAVGLWTAENDVDPGAASGDPETKAELKVTCQPPIDADADAVTLQLEFGNFMARAFPELVNRNNELALVQHARFAELNLLSHLTALSTPVTHAATLGIGRDILAGFAKAGSAYRNRHRMPRNTPLRVIAPEWVLDAVRIDLGRGLPGDTNIAYADSQINTFMTAQHVRPTWHMDGVFAAQASGAALVDYPTSFVYYIFAEGSFLYLDGGTLDLGVVRDSGLVSTNDYKTFSETFEGLAMIGVESLAVTQTVNLNGNVRGTV